jgi:hypothetical protein
MGRGHKRHMVQATLDKKYEVLFEKQLKQNGLEL